MAGKAIDKFRRADNQVRKKLPPGVKLLHTLRGHTSWIGRIAWSADGKLLASPSNDRTVRLWDTETGECLQTLKGHTGPVMSTAFDPAGRFLASGSHDNTLHLWDLATGQLVRTIPAHSKAIQCVAFDPSGTTLASSSSDRTIKLWDPLGGGLIRILEGHGDTVREMAFDPRGEVLASASDDHYVKLWETSSGTPLRTLLGPRGYVFSVAFSPSGADLACAGLDGSIWVWDARSETGKLLRTLEHHTSYVTSIAFLSGSHLLASKSGDGTIGLWNAQTGDWLATLAEGASNYLPPGLAFHPNRPLLATVGVDPGVRQSGVERLIHIYQLDVAALSGTPTEPTAHYVNAKMVLVGDTGVGKSGLSLVLTNQPFEATDSTPGRHVWTFDSREVTVSPAVSQTREALLWDLAGQPGYRIIHQLHLNEVAVALVVFDARSETDPLAGVRHWERALRLAQQRQGSAAIPMKKFLVSARNDRGGVSVSKDRLNSLVADFNFDGYFETSAKEGWQIPELRFAMEQAIAWNQLPEVSSSRLFAAIKAFLLEIKETGRLLAPAKDLFDDFAKRQADAAANVANLRDQFDRCIGRLENRDLIRGLTFGGYVLLQPELLDAYASAMVNTAKEEPDGLGSLAEEAALGGKFFVPREHKVADSAQEQLLLHATVEELVRHDLALRENADDGRYLVFPSQFNRDYEDAPEPKGKEAAITFDGPVQSLYSTLAVRLGHSGLFTTGRAEMWRNAAIFTAKAGGRCGLFLQEFAEARGRLTLFYDEHASLETRYHFEEFVLAHAKRRALDGTVDVIRFFVCAKGHPVPDEYVKLLQAQNKDEFPCPCGKVVSLAEPKERIRFQSQVDRMDRAADDQRDFEAFVMSAKGETSTKSFQDWAGSERVTLAIVFTDVVGSTALGEEIRDESMNEVRRAHFAQSRKLIDQFHGREIKTIGDSFMAAFKSVDAALNFARALQASTGSPQVQVRAGIHIGPMHVEEGDVFGGTVNFAARVVGAIKGAEIWLSDRAKEDIDRLGSKQYRTLSWLRHDDLQMKGFPGKFTLWSV